MNIEECKKEDGLYFLLQCGNRMSEFELIIKNKKELLYEIKIKPFKKIELDETDIDLMCDLYESEDWKSINE